MVNFKHIMVPPKLHIAAYLNKAKVKSSASPLECDQDLVDKVTSNYLIIKKILSHLSWQDQMICSTVCRMWNDAVNTLQKEVKGPCDFVYEMKECPELIKSTYTATPPLFVMVFANFAGFSKAEECDSVKPSPCKPYCDYNHWLVDCANKELCFPKDCMLVVIAIGLSYMSIPSSPTARLAFPDYSLISTGPYMCGMYIPKIQDVKMNMIHITESSDLDKEFYDVVRDISRNRIFKGVVAMVTDKFLLDSIDSIEFLKEFMEVQKDIPFAMGGCIVEDTVFCDKELYSSAIKKGDFEKYVSPNVLSIVMFTMPKESQNKANFDMYSLVIDSNEWSKGSIEKAVKEFSDKVPRTEHSLVYRFTCVGRDKRHEFEQDVFRASFPDTTIIGCYGNGELGLNHPARSQDGPKRRKKESNQDCPFMYSYATVFLYFCWGKSVV